MDNASLVTKLSNVQVAYTDEILHACAKRLQAGDDAEDVVVTTLEALALERARLLKECIALKARAGGPGRMEIELGPEGAPSSEEIDKRLKHAQGKPLVEVFAEDEAKKV